MPSIVNANLTLAESEGLVTVRVRYDAVFTPFERELAGLGMTFHSHITAHGMDGATVGPPVKAVDFPQRAFAVVPGRTDQVIPRDESETVGRDDLREVTGLGDGDELLCNIRIHAVGLPPEFTPDAFTDQELLPS